MGSKTQTTLHGTSVAIIHELTPRFERPNVVKQKWDASPGVSHGLIEFGGFVYVGSVDSDELLLLLVKL